MILPDGQMLLGDCLDVMRQIPDGSVDMVLCDLPYGTTACAWDQVIPFEPLWAEYWRVCKPDAAVVLTASQPFTSALIMSQIKQFRYEWIWNKVQPSGFPNANRMPLKLHENICVFSREKIDYKPQKTFGHPVRKRSRTGKTAETYGGIVLPADASDDSRFPVSIIEIAKGWSPYNRPVHPTQKPVDLFEYIIKTYTNPGETVLDNCSGSGTTAVAAHRTGRRFICIERDPAYYLASCGRIWKEYQQ